MSADAARRGVPFFTRIVAFLARSLLRLAARVRVEGLDNLPRDGPLIVVANHLSNADPPLVAGWLTPALGRQLHILAKESLFVGPLSIIFRALGASPVRKGGSDMEAFRVAKGVLDRGEVLCIFPEGTRSTGALIEPKPGVAMLALRSAVQILPVGVSGTDTFLGRGQMLPRLRTRVTLRVGRPFVLEADPALSRRDATAAASDELMRRIAALVDERHRGRFGVPASP
jgi:1-acyl-sn-glycerol-3-phosphate acyltransferase